MIKWTMTRNGQSKSLKDVPYTAQIESVNGRVCVGMCENCSKPILEGHKHHHDTEGIMWHARCRSNT